MIFADVGFKVGMIGDPHLGKDFDINCPIHRRGERAILQMSQFKEEHEADADVIIQVGDLFDHPMVSNGVVVQAAGIVLAAARARPDVTFIHMAGNHDRSRNLKTVGAWEVFEAILRDKLPNLHLVSTPTIINEFAIFPWQWGRTALEQVDDLKGAGMASIAVGHWDLKAFEGKDDHLCPARALQDRFGSIPIYSGHFHKAGEYLVDGLPVTCTGSMQPYAHGEGDMYVKVTSEEALTRQDLRDKCVKVRLKPGEDVPDIDCLSLTWERIAVEKDTEAVVVTDESFDFSRKIREVVEAQTPEVGSFISDRLNVDDTEQH